MVKELSRAMSPYVVAHLFLFLLYYFLYFIMTTNEVAPVESAKYLLVAITVVNVITYLAACSMNQEKRTERRIKKELFMYSFVIVEILAVAAIYGLVSFLH